MTGKRIGWIGTGVMGSSMCGHLLQAGHAVRVFNRSRAKALALEERGAVWCDTAAEAARGSEVVFTIVGFPRDVEEVYFGPDGVLAGAAPGSVVVDMTTSEPSLAVRIQAAAAARGLGALDAPVSGGDIGAREASLAIMVGGEEAVFARVKPLFELLGRNVRRMGEAGAGQHTKMSNQILIAGNMIGVVESLLYARRAGLDLDAVIDVIGSGAAGSWSINNLGRRIAKGDFAPGFFIKHFIKDMGIALAEARAMRLALPGLALVQQFYLAAQAEGLEDLGTQALYKVLERLSGL
ncbi:MAG: NAD(P)-dependent oxidoreductase [Solidesulfovibrio sp.]|uniref:NAD(P)-dependent oxidoreductase n=1 Tax=Solidesulfovibrio sp. TaxID=2910990 RepID=UPI002B1FEA87|nr:NAD(P)-dependent oxidoreductase [Solidesulfovibrio sp.]MEA4855953.1 NAD(P)-dependent oxidoreductase [Solidesulfovibrio sp.]